MQRVQHVNMRPDDDTQPQIHAPLVPEKLIVDLMCLSNW